MKLNWSSRFQSLTESDKLAQCRGAGLCWTTASDLLYPPRGKNQSSLPHGWIGCGRVHLTGELKEKQLPGAMLSKSIRSAS